MNTETDRIKRVEDFLLDPERALFTTLEEFRAAVNEMLPVIRAIDLNTLATLRGEDGITPQRGKDYMTADDISALEQFILSKMPVTDVDYPSTASTEAFINFQVSKIPRIKGDRGEPGRPGTSGSDGSPDTGADILRKLRTLGRNQGLQIDDIRGLENRIKIYNTAVDELAQLRIDFDNQRFVVPANVGGSGGGGAPGATAWGSITGLLSAQTDLQTALDLKYDDTNPSGYISNITGKVSAGTNVTITGLGTTASPYVINSSAGGGGSGDVVGPASAVDNRVAFFDGATGKLIKDSGLTLAGSNTGDNATNTQYSGLASSKQDTLVSGTNIKTVNGTSLLGSGDLVTTQTSIVGITGTIAQFNTALTDGDFATGGGTATGANTGDQTSIVGITGTIAQFNTAVTDADLATLAGVETLSNKTISGALTLAENASMALDPVLSADGAYSGMTITGVAGTTLAFGDLVYLAVADSRWELVDADAVATAGAVLTGICVLAAAGDGSATTILLKGNIRADSKFPALTVGAQVYASTTPGEVQVAQPSGTDDVVHVIGFALTADSIIFNPSPDYITHI